MNVFEGFNWINYRANKDQTGRTYTPDQYNLAHKAVRIEYFKLKYGLPEEYQPGQPLPRQAWQITSKITDDLRNCKVFLGDLDNPSLSIDKYGYADIPEDYIHYSTIRYDSYENTSCGVSEKKFNPVEVLTDAAFDYRLSSRVKRPTKKYPICRFHNNKIEFAPVGMGKVNFIYFRMPVAGVLGYTIDDNGNVVYNPATSVQLEWPEDTHTDIYNLMYQWLGENLKDSLIIQQSQQRKNQGI